jgi:hypothetical protein
VQTVLPVLLHSLNRCSPAVAETGLSNFILLLKDPHNAAAVS